MRPKIIESLGQWYILKKAIIEKGYKLWQMQYNYDSSEGFHSWFFKSDKEVEVITYCKKVQDDIINSKMT